MTTPPAPPPTRVELRAFIDGQWVDGHRSVTLQDVYEGTPVADVHQVAPHQVDAALAGLRRGRDDVLGPYARCEVLSRAAELVQQRADTFVEAMVAETGFVAADARRDVQRTVQTLLLSGEEAKRIAGEMVPIEADRSAPQRIGFTLRRPVGIVCAITPFNSPLNTLAHKVAPALAAGNSVAVKPAHATPWSADLLIRTLLEAGLPPRLVALLHGGGGEVGRALVSSQIPDFYAFTGSTDVGREILAGIGVRRAQVELGSLSSTLVCEDADIALAARACAEGAFRKAGQVCTSVQRLYVHESIIDAFLSELRRITASLTAGDPRDPETSVGPLIDTAAADRVERWIARALDAGATQVTAATRSGNVISPVVLADVQPDLDVMCREVFGPVVSVVPYRSLDEAIREANATPYGLSAGVFTNDVGRALQCAKQLQVGAVHVNATSSSRTDLMPFGGMKDSGYGKEGPKYAVREMTDEVLVTLGAGHG